MGVEDVEVEDEAPSLRETLESAYEAAEAPEADDSPAPAPEATDAPEATEEDAATPEAPKDGRDEKGRFKPKAAASPEAPAKGPAAAVVQPKAGEAPVAQPAAAVALEAPKAPQSWRADVREKWAALPEEVRKEVVRREYEVKRAMDESAEARRTADGFRQAVSPYEGMIRAEGGDALTAVGSLLRTAAALRTAPPQHKAGLIANMVRTFGVPIEMLDAALTQQPMPQGQQPQQFRDSRFDDFLGHLKQQQAQRSEAITQQAQAEVQEFAASHDFYEDVKHDMADLMELHARRGQPLDYQGAYDKAVLLNPHTAAAVKQREAAQAATAQQASVQRARNASSSIRSQPTGRRSNGDTGERSLREDLTASWDEVEGR